MNRLPRPVRLARIIARAIARAYPRSVKSHLAEIHVFNDDALVGAWERGRAPGLMAALARLSKDVAASRWRGAALPVTTNDAPRAHLNGGASGGPRGGPRLWAGT